MQLCVAVSDDGRPVRSVRSVRVAYESSVSAGVVLGPYGQRLPLECWDDLKTHAPPSPLPAATPPLRISLNTVIVK